MKVTLGWLKDHLETDASLDTIVERLTMIGLEVDGVEDRGKAFAPFTVGRVVSAVPHPDADRLRVCVVDTGSGEVQVVCGAPNARAGMKGVFAPSGTWIPGTRIQLRKTTIRGVESNGMLLSERELGLSDEHEGIVDLPADAPVGAPYAAYAGLDDPVIEIGLTPNRGDCAGVRGIARDLAAAGLGRLKPLPTWSEMVPGAFDSPIGVRLDLPDEARDACRMFAGRYIRGVRNGPSPAWLQERLRAVGLRPISALVDITNFFTLDTARPLHVFDAAEVRGDIRARFARPGETLLALDGREYEAGEGMTMIADDERALGFGGIIGGEETGCTEATTEVFLESAWFDPVRTAATGRRIGVHSDARYRFERGVDPRSIVAGMEAATRMILDLCGGEASLPVVAGEEPEWRRRIGFRPSRVKALAGVDVPEDESGRILAALGFEVQTGGAEWRVSPPSWRPDVNGEADLVEEVVRIHGYDNIPVVPVERPTSLPEPALDAEQSRAVRARRGLAVRGLIEAVTFSFMPTRHAVLFGGGDEALRVANPISADLDAMRPSILPNLIDAARRNRDRGLGDAGLFEVGPQYADPTPGGQALVAAGLRWGASGPRHWETRPRPVDVFDAKADALAAVRACGGPADTAQVTRDAPAWYHPGRSGTLRLGKVVLGWFGEIHPAVMRALDLDGPAAGFEVFLDRVPETRGKDGKGRPLLTLWPFQPVARDFAFVVDADVAAEQVARAARSADRALVDQVTVFDIYAGPGIDEGRKSVAIEVRFQPREATLTEADLEALTQKVVQAVERATGGRLRG